MLIRLFVLLLFNLSLGTATHAELASTSIESAIAQDKSFRSSIPIWRLNTLMRNSEAEGKNLYTSAQTALIHFKYWCTLAIQ